MLIAITNCTLKEFRLFITSISSYLAIEIWNEYMGESIAPVFSVTYRWRCIIQGVAYFIFFKPSLDNNFFDKQFKLMDWKWYY
jgi:hypothetical protein